MANPNISHDFTSVAPPEAQRQAFSAREAYEIEEWTGPSRGVASRSASSYVGARRPQMRIDANREEDASILPVVGLIILIALALGAYLYFYI